jgi:hypothetical protein
MLTHMWRGLSLHTVYVAGTILHVCGEDYPYTSMAWIILEHVFRGLSSQDVARTILLHMYRIIPIYACSGIASDMQRTKRLMFFLLPAAILANLILNQPAPPVADSYGAPAESYGAPVESYGAPAESYGAPVESYGAPAYEEPASSYSAPSYSAPSYSAPSYSAPAPSYSAPSYSAPAPSYSAPAPSYSAPSYSAPAPSYSAPAPSYSAPSYSSDSYGSPAAPVQDSYGSPAQPAYGRK